MVKTAVCLDIARQRRVEGLSPRSDPIEDGTFQALRIVGSRVRGSLLNLISSQLLLG
jgi:hypothetical protein